MVACLQQGMPRCRCSPLLPRVQDVTHCSSFGLAVDTSSSGIGSQPTSLSGPEDEVSLHVYSTWASGIAACAGITATHVGIAVFGWEFSFITTGIHIVKPATFDASRHIDVVQLGKTPLTKEQAWQAILDLQLVYKPHEYHPCGRNCQTFALELCRRLRVDRDKIPLCYVSFAETPPSCKDLSGSCEVLTGNNKDIEVQPLEDSHRAMVMLEAGEELPESSPKRLQPRRIPQRFHRRLSLPGSSQHWHSIAWCMQSSWSGEVRKRPALESIPHE